MKFVKVSNSIKTISSKQVTFTCDRAIRRIHDKRTNWMLRKDGIYVRKELVESHNLTEA